MKVDIFRGTKNIFNSLNVSPNLTHEKIPIPPQNYMIFYVPYHSPDVVEWGGQKYEHNYSSEYFLVRTCKRESILIKPCLI